MAKQHIHQFDQCSSCGALRDHVPDQYEAGYRAGEEAATLRVAELLKHAYSAVPENRKGRTRCIDPDPAGGTYDFLEHEWSVKARQILGLKYEPTGI